MHFSFATLFSILAVISIVTLIWQWYAAIRFPIQRVPHTVPAASPIPLTLLKPLKGCDLETESCLESWFQQNPSARYQLLFGVASLEDPACSIVHKLLSRYPNADA